MSASMMTLSNVKAENLARRESTRLFNVAVEILADPARRFALLADVWKTAMSRDLSPLDANACTTARELALRPESCSLKVAEGIRGLIVKHATPTPEPDPSLADGEGDASAVAEGRASVRPSVKGE